MPRRLTPEQIEALRNPSFVVMHEGCRFCGVICRNECESGDEAKTCANLGADGSLYAFPMGTLRSSDGQCAFNPETGEFRIPIDSTCWQRFKSRIGRMVGWS